MIVPNEKQLDDFLSLLQQVSDRALAEAKEVDGVMPDVYGGLMLQYQIALGWKLALPDMIEALREAQKL